MFKRSPAESWADVPPTRSAYTKLQSYLLRHNKVRTINIKFQFLWELEREQTRHNLSYGSHLSHTIVIETTHIITCTAIQNTPTLSGDCRTFHLRNYASNSRDGSFGWLSLLHTLLGVKGIVCSWIELLLHLLTVLVHIKALCIDCCCLLFSWICLHSWYFAHSNHLLILLVFSEDARGQHECAIDLL